MTDLGTAWSCFVFHIFHHGILQRNYWKMTMEWSFSYNSFVKLSLYDRICLLHGPFLWTPNTALYGPQREKTCLRGFANNTGADQPAHQRSLISAFVIRFLESTIFNLATRKISIF